MAGTITSAHFTSPEVARSSRTARLRSTLCTCRFASRLRLKPDTRCGCRAGERVGTPQRVLDVTPCGYPQHPFGTVHAKIIFSMKANGVLDFDINELGYISRDLGVLLWTAESSPPVFRDAAGRLASPKRYGALTGSPPETAVTARVPAFEHGTGTYACAVPRMRDIRRVGSGAEPLAVQQLR